MANDEFTILLDKRLGYSVQGAELGGAVLRGKPVYRKGSTGVADSIDDTVAQNGVHASTYALIRGRAFTDKEDAAWSEWHDSKAERITALDKNGIIGEKGVVYALDIQNGGLFVWNPARIREAVTSGSLVNGALQLSQDEVDVVLGAIQRKDHAALAQIVHGGDVVYAGNYPGFLEASVAPDFTKGMDGTYLVLRPAEEARKLYSDRRPIAEQRSNPDLVIASAGKEPLKAMLDQAERFKWANFGSWHDGYTNENTGRVVVLGGSSGGVDGDDYLLSISGRSVRVAPEALDAF